MFEPTRDQIEKLGRAKWQTDTARDLATHPAFQGIIRAAQAEALRDAVEAHTIIATGYINPRDLLDEAAWIEAADVL